MEDGGLKIEGRRTDKIRLRKSATDLGLLAIVANSSDSTRRTLVEDFRSLEGKRRPSGRCSTLHQAPPATDTNPPSSTLHLPSSILHALAYIVALLLIVIAATAFAPPALAHDPGQHATQEEILNTVAFDQKLGAQVPLDTPFVDENGQAVSIGDVILGKPAVLVFAYFECPNLCPTVLASLTEALRGLKLDVGDQFNVAVISIDPNETPALAADTELKYIRSYGRLSTDGGWHFLTGEHAAIDAVTDAVGFKYAYDPEIDQFAHGTGLLVLTPTGKVSRYLYGLEFPARDLQLGLMEAADQKIGSPVDQLLLRCYRYDPSMGKYTLAIMNVVRVASITTALLLGGFMLLMFRQAKA